MKCFHLAILFTILTISPCVLGVRRVDFNMPAPEFWADNDNRNFVLVCVITNPSDVSQHVIVRPMTVPFASLDTKIRGLEAPLTAGVVNDEEDIAPGASLRSCWGRATTYDTTNNPTSPKCRYMFPRALKIEVTTDAGYLIGSCFVNTQGTTTLNYSYLINGGRPF